MEIGETLSVEKYIYTDVVDSKRSTFSVNRYKKDWQWVGTTEVTIVERTCECCNDRFKVLEKGSNTPVSVSLWRTRKPTYHGGDMYSCRF
jgi:hypothetical protein